MEQEFNRSVTLVSVSRIHRQALEVASLVILNYHYTRLFKMHAFAYLRYGPKRLFYVISEDNVIFTTVSMSSKQSLKRRMQIVNATLLFFTITHPDNTVDTQCIKVISF